jgi:hypothetical protein
MSRVAKPAVAIPHDPELAAAEARRLEELANSGAYQRGVAQAKAQEISNARHALNTDLDNLKRATASAYTGTAGWDKYFRTYNRVVRAAERVALATGKPVVGVVPKQLPKPTEPEAQETVTIAVPTPAPTPAVKPIGRSGLPLTGPGSNTDPIWMGAK